MSSTCQISSLGPHYSFPDAVSPKRLPDFARLMSSQLTKIRFPDRKWDTAFPPLGAPALRLPSLPQKIVAVGHRGTKLFAPENTIAAHERAYLMGARAMEFDVRCTKDGHFILMHDQSVSRTTNGKGLVKDLSLADIRALTATSHKDPKFHGEKIPTLREALRNVRGRFAIDIDYKGGPSNSGQLLDRILTEEGFGAPDAPLVTIFARRHHFNILKPLMENFALRPHYISSSHVETIASQYPIKVFGLRRLSFSPKAAASIRRNGLNLFSNVMGRYDHDAGYEDARRAGSLFIQTDHLERLIPYLRSRGLLETKVLGRNYRALS